MGKARKKATRDQPIRAEYVIDGIMSKIGAQALKQQDNPNALIKIGRVCELIGISRTTLHRIRERDATFPVPKKDGDSRQAPVYFLRSEVESWIRTKMDSRSAA